MLEADNKKHNCTEGPVAHGFVPDKEQENESFFHEVKNNFSKYYGQYITRQIFDLASFIAPITRFANSEMWKSLFQLSPTEIAKDAYRLSHFSDDGSASGGDYITDHFMYAVGWTMTAMKTTTPPDPNYPILEESSKKLIDTWLRELGGFPAPKYTLKEAVDAYYLIRSFYESDSYKRYIKESFNKLLAGYKYMNSMPWFCDVPSSELVLYPVISQYSYPSHFDIEETKRFLYTADGKSTEMFLDVTVFDTCRYIYDWLPSTELISDAFDVIGYQLVYRFALDGIAKHTLRYTNDYLYGAHVIGVNYDGFREKILTSRIKIR